MGKVEGREYTEAVSVLLYADVLPVVRDKG